MRSSWVCVVMLWVLGACAETGPCAEVRSCCGRDPSGDDMEACLRVANTGDPNQCNACLSAAHMVGACEPPPAGGVYPECRDLVACCQEYERATMTDAMCAIYQDVADTNDREACRVPRESFLEGWPTDPGDAPAVCR